MKAAETFLPKLVEHRPSSPGRSTLNHTDTASGWSVAATIEKADDLSCQLWDIAVQRKQPESADPAAMKNWAHAIADRVTGLMEPLRVLELDDVRHEAVLRSESTTQRNDKRFHYEVKLQGTQSATLRRFQAGVEPASKREQIPFTLTHETLGKFLDDVAECAG
jgi:hypothetical protein